MPTPFDLHALGTPPALILSQDQTLHQCVSAKETISLVLVATHLLAFTLCYLKQIRSRTSLPIKRKLACEQSARSVFGTRRSSSGTPHRLPVPRLCASLSTCSRAMEPDTGRASASHPAQSMPATRSACSGVALFQEPAELTVPALPLS